MLALAMLAAGAMTHTRVLDDGTVVSRVLIDASVQNLRERLASPADVDSLLGDSEVLSQRADGECYVVERRRPHPLMDVVFSTRACPTAFGFEEDLIASEQLSSYHSSWRFVPTDAGTQVVYSVHTSLRMPAPESLIRRESVKGAHSLVQRLQGALEG